MLQVWHKIEAYNGRRISLSQFARLTGVSRQYMYDLQHGRIVPTDEKFTQIAKAWGVSVNQLRARLAG